MNVKLFDLLTKKYSNLDIEHTANLSYQEKINLIIDFTVILTARLHILIASIVYVKIVYIYSCSHKIDYILEEQKNNSKVKKYEKKYISY